MDYILLTYLPESFVILLPSIIMIVIGLMLEKHYIGRITVFSNVCALYYELFWVTGMPLVWTIIIAVYANIGLVFAIYALIKYRKNESCSKWVYNVFWLYSSAVIGILMVILAMLFLF